MHAYLSAIGFSKLNKESLAELLEEIKLRPDYQESALDFDGNQFVELRYMVADNIGLVLRGEYNDLDEFILDYYYPTFFSGTNSTSGDIDIIKDTDKNNYHVMCDEIRLGITLIFQLQNMAEFLHVAKGKNSGDTNAIKIAGLSIDGKIILPLYVNAKSKEKAEIKQQKRYNLLDAAREGDEEAIESLTLQEIDTYSKISRRISNSDILTVVSSYFMPFGIENDKYDILGEIKDMKRVINHLTMEELYILTINSNDVDFEICINKKDLFGEPAIGRRFKGTVWLQGSVDFSEN